MKKIIFIGIVCTSVIVFSSPSVALAAGGLSDSESPSTPVEMTVSAFSHVMNAGHVANGVVLRNRDSGTIHLRGVPSGSTVIKGYLYFNYSNLRVAAAASQPALFDGNLVIGAKVADNADPCWGLNGNHTYRADVTSFVDPANPNQDYDVVLEFGLRRVTSGENPWLSSPGNTKLEGATLIVVFSNAGTAGKAVVLYDALSGTEFSSTLNVTLVHPISLSGTGLYTISGADGQRGSGHDNAASNEIGFFNGVQTSGPPVAASDWDGAAGLPLPQLWDVHTHLVSFDTQSSSVVKYNAGIDCLVPVVFVLEANTP